MSAGHSHNEQSNQSVKEDEKERVGPITLGWRANLARPDVPNRTKVVRIFVLPDCVDPARDIDLLNKIAAHRGASRADIFVKDGDSDVLQPWSWLGDRMVDHQSAHGPGGHVETTVVLMGLDREQLEWQCDVPFVLSAIEKNTANDDHSREFPLLGDAPEYPFMREVRGLRGDRCNPIRSGSTIALPDAMDLPKQLGAPQTFVEVSAQHPRLRKAAGWNALYKAHFLLELNGKWKRLDPDFYCDWT